MQEGADVEALGRLWGVNWFKYHDNKTIRLQVVKETVRVLKNDKAAGLYN